MPDGEQKEIFVSGDTSVYGKSLNLLFGYN